MRMNNKGQSLISFILLLPLFVLIIVALTELGEIQITKYKYQNQVKDVVKYGINHFDEENLQEKMENLLTQNIDGDFNIIIGEDNIKINLKKNISSPLTKLIKTDSQISITYIGNVNTKQITKE